MKKHFREFRKITQSNKKSNGVKSVAVIYFPQRNLTLSYYNDLFDLHKGDLVYVDGKLAGHQGQVVDVVYSFKIKLSDYQRVIALVDTDIRGELCFSERYMLSFGPGTLPYEKVKTWFFPPVEQGVYAVSTTETCYFIAHPEKATEDNFLAERGKVYFQDGHIFYLSLDGAKGKAVALGSEYYEIEFTYADGAVKNPVCSCYCGGICKHIIAVMYQLNECLERIARDYPNQGESGFAMIDKSVFVNRVFRGRSQGTIQFK